MCFDNQLVVKIRYILGTNLPKRAVIRVKLSVFPSLCGRNEIADFSYFSCLYDLYYLSYLCTAYSA